MDNIWHFDYVRLAFDAGFCFDNQKAKFAFDWSTLSLVDIERIIQDRDIAVIEKHIPTVLNFTIDEELSKVLEANFLKVFRLSQLSLQYLIFCKKYLDNTVSLLKNELSRTNDEIQSKNQREEELKTEMNSMKRRIRELKVALEYQPILTENAFRCKECSKMFATEEYLAAHEKRRHDNTPSPRQIETDKLQVEIKELKEKLNSTEKFGVNVERTKEAKNDNDRKSNDDYKKNDSNSNDNDYKVRVKELQEKFDRLKEHVEVELKSVNDQKFYLEKYEKWMEMAFLKFGNPQKETYEKQEKILSLKDIAVQTFEEEKVRSDPSEILKLQQQIQSETTQQMQNFEDAFQEKLAFSLRKLEKRMDLFWGRINEENEKKLSEKKSEEDEMKTEEKVKSDKNETSVVKEKRPKPTPRSIYTDPKENLSINSKRRSLWNAPTITKPDGKKNLPPGKKMFSVLKKESATTWSEEESSVSSEEVTSEEKEERGKEGSKIRSKEQSEETMESEETSISTEEEVSEEEEEMKNKEQSKEQNKGQSKNSSQRFETTSAERVLSKPSNTSTLAKHSITSLKQAAIDVEVKIGLRKELEDVLEQRLKEIGVSSEWKGIPEKTFKRALIIVRHQATLASKGFRNFSTIRNKIIKQVEDELKKRNLSKKKHTKRQEKSKDDVKEIFSREKRNAAIKEQKIQNMYETSGDSSSELKSKTEQTNFSKMHREKSVRAAFINELEEAVGKRKFDSSEDELVDGIKTKAKSVLKSGTSMSSLSKKKVLFDLESVSNSNSPIVIKEEDSAGKIVLRNDNKEIKQDGIYDKVEKENLEPKTFLKTDAIGLIEGQKKRSFLGIDSSESTSIGSSVLELDAAKKIEKKEEIKNEKKKDDSSDFDISDILT